MDLGGKRDQDQRPSQVWRRRVAEQWTESVNPIFGPSKVPDFKYQILPSNGIPHPRPKPEWSDMTEQLFLQRWNTIVAVVCRRGRRQIRFYDCLTRNGTRAYSIIRCSCGILIVLPSLGRRRNTASSGSTIRFTPLLNLIWDWEEWKRQAVEIRETRDDGHVWHPEENGEKQMTVKCKLI